MLEGSHVVVERIRGGDFCVGRWGSSWGSEGVRGSLSVLVRLTAGLMVGVVLVSSMLSLSFVVLELVVISATVEAIVVMSESVSGSRGYSGVGGAVWWLGGTGLSAVLSGNCWAIRKQLQFSLMVWH